MAVQLPPIPNNPITDTFVWRDWFFKVSQLLVQQASIAWSSIDFTGSNLLDIQTRQHNALQAVQGGLSGQYYHLTAAEHAAVAALPTLGTMATQNADSVNITGGTAALDHLRTKGLTGFLYGNDNTSDVTAYTTIPPSAINTQYGAFHFDFSTTLNGAITSSATTITVVSTSGFSSSGAILIENEVITYTGTTSTTFTGCSRGAYGSTAASHSSGAYVNGAQGTTAATATLLQLNTTDLSNGVTLNTSNSQVSVAVAGTYNLQFSVQTFNFDNTPDNFTIWFRKNGTDVANSASIQTTPAIHAGVQGSAIVTVNLFLTLAASDYVQLYWITDGGKSVVVTANPGTSPVHPASPAVIFTVNQIS